MSIVLDKLIRWYGTQAIVDQVSLEVPDGELFVLLGASGSGKSTVLRLIAGLIQPDAGRIVLHGRDVTDVPPQQRNMGFVFQNYSIFRHMTVAQNIEFGLKIRRVPPGERARRRDELLDLVGLVGLGNRYAHQLSGGQQQRVALARALAYEPKVLLLDEPFGALDVKIRAQLRRTLKEIQRRLQITTILVTHDQEEAFELADRIGVIERGKLLEVGAPETLYAYPRTVFTATFLGTATVLVGRVDNGYARFGSLQLPLPLDSATDYEDGDRVQILVRPEQVALSVTEPKSHVPVIGRGTIVEHVFAGDRRRLRLRLPHLPGVRQIAPAAPFGEEGLLVDTVVPTDVPLAGDAIWVSLRAWHMLKPPPRRLLLYDPTANSVITPVLTRWLAEKLDATVTVLGIAATNEALDPVATMLQRYLDAADLPAELHLRVGDAEQHLTIEQTESLYDLLVLGCGESTDAGATAQPPDVRMIERIARSGMTPILLVKGSRTQLLRILICTAGGEPGKNDVRTGGRLARRFGATVTILHVSNPVRGVSLLAKTHLEQAAATLRALDVANTVQIYPSTTPSEGILHVAGTNDYDLIVIGNHGPIMPTLFGSSDVTRQVITHAPCSVLIVPDDAL